MRLIDIDPVIVKAKERETPLVTVELLEKLPTISPDEVRGVGEWIPLDYSDEAYGNMYKCAKCGCSEIGEPNYCPNCGAKMEVTSDA